MTSRIRSWYIGRPIGRSLGMKLRRERAVITYLEANPARSRLVDIIKDLARYGTTSSIRESIWALQRARIIALQYGVEPAAVDLPLPPSWRENPVYVKMWALIRADSWTSIGELAMRCHTTTHTINGAINNFVRRRYMWRSKVYWLVDGYPDIAVQYFGPLDANKSRGLAKANVLCHAVHMEVVRSWCEALVWAHAEIVDTIPGKDKRWDEGQKRRARRWAGTLETAVERATKAQEIQDAHNFPFMWAHARVVFPQNTSATADRTRVGMIRNGLSALAPVVKALEPMVKDTGPVGAYRNALLRSIQEAKAFLADFPTSGF